MLRISAATRSAASPAAAAATPPHQPCSISGRFSSNSASSVSGGISGNAPVTRGASSMRCGLAARGGLRGVCTAASTRAGQPVFNPMGYAKYAAAIPAQVGLMTGALWALQRVCDGLASGALPLPAGASADDVSRGAVVLFFLVVSVKSRVFSPLDASRPNVRGEKAAIGERRRPGWMPPPLTFPVVWTTIGLLRAASSVAVWEASGRDLVAAPLIVMMLHLAIGDAWNHCNNVERNLGMAVPGVILGCLGSGIGVAAAYYATDPTAGLLLAPMVVWLAIASALVTSIWRINPGEDGELVPLVPVKESA